jgi:hypothetical protein
MENNTSSLTRDRLKKKLKKKKDQRTGKSSNTAKTGIPELDNVEGGDIFQMIQQVQNMLKTNPDLVTKVSSCINSVMNNTDVMQKLTTEIEQTIHSQTLDTSVSGVESDAVSKES